MYIVSELEQIHSGGYSVLDLSLYHQRKRDRLQGKGHPQLHLQSTEEQEGSLITPSHKESQVIDVKRGILKCKYA